MKPVSIKTKPAPWCPEDGAIMKLRRPKPGQSWEPFWGCSQFPACKGTRQIDEWTGEPVYTEAEDEAWAYQGSEREL